MKILKIWQIKFYFIKITKLNVKMLKLLLILLERFDKIKI